MPDDCSMTNAEFRFACIVWVNEPVCSPDLARLCEEQLGWKRTTTYTVLKRLCDRGLMQNQSAMVTSLVTREQVLQHASRSVMETRFDDQLPQFIAAFLSGQTLSTAEAEEIKRLIDRHKEG